MAVSPHAEAAVGCVQPSEAQLVECTAAWLTREVSSVRLHTSLANRCEVDRRSCIPAFFAPRGNHTHDPGSSASSCRWAPSGNLCARGRLSVESALIICRPARARALPVVCGFFLARLVFSRPHRVVHNPPPPPRVKGRTRDRARDPPEQRGAPPAPLVVRPRVEDRPAGMDRVLFGAGQLCLPPALRRAASRGGSALALHRDPSPTSPSSLARSATGWSQFAGRARPLEKPRARRSASVRSRRTETATRGAVHAAAR